MTEFNGIKCSRRLQVPDVAKGLMKRGTPWYASGVLVTQELGFLCGGLLYFYVRVLLDGNWLHVNV